MIDIELLQEAISLTQSGQIEQAQKIYQSLLEQNPNDANLLSVYGLFYVNIGNYDKACEILKKASEINETFGTISALGFAEFERRNYLEAAVNLEKAVSLGKNPDIYNKLVMSLFEIKSYKKAVEYADKEDKIFPHVEYRQKHNCQILQSGNYVELLYVVESQSDNPPKLTLIFPYPYLCPINKTKISFFCLIDKTIISIFCLIHKTKRILSPQTLQCK